MGRESRAIRGRIREVTTGMSREKIEAIIPVANEIVGDVNFATRTVRNLLDNTEHDNYDVTVIDDGNDASCEGLQDLGVRVRVVRNDGPVRGVGVARNLGSACTNGSWLFTADAHMRFDREMLRKDKKGHVTEALRKQDILIDMQAAALEWESTHLDPATGAPLPAIFQAVTLGYDDSSKMFKAGCDWKFHEKQHVPDGRWSSTRPEAGLMPTAVLMGACYLMRRETLEYLGGWLCGAGRGYNEAYLSTAALMCGVPIFTIGHTYARHLYESKIPTYRVASLASIAERIRLGTHVLYDECRPRVQDRAWGEGSATTDREMNHKHGTAWATQRATVQQNRVLGDEEVLRAMGLWGEYDGASRGSDVLPAGDLSFAETHERLMAVADSPSTLSMAVAFQHVKDGQMTRILKAPGASCGTHEPVELSLLLGSLELLKREAIDNVSIAMAIKREAGK